MQSTSEKPALYDLADIERTARLMCVEGGVYELRCPKAGPYRNKTYSGYYDDPRAMVRDAMRCSGTVPAVYMTLNPVNRALLGRAANRLNQQADLTSADKDALRRRRLLVDTDPIRPSGISSTEAELEAALGVSRAVWQYLQDRGWPAGLLAMSGNGGHVVHALDLPNDEESTQLLKRFLLALDAKFRLPGQVGVDTTVFNASRISKVYGTLAMKGDDIPERPHRICTILYAPDTLSVVPVELIRAVVDEHENRAEPVVDAPGAKPAEEEPAADEDNRREPPPAAAGPKVAWMDEWLERHGVEIRSTKAGGKWLYRWVVRTCPFCGESDKAACITLSGEGKYGYTCLHNRCSEKDGQPKKNWHDFRARYDKGRTKTGQDFGKYDGHAHGYLDALIAQRRYPLYHAGVFYTHDGNRYVEEPDLPMAVRGYFRNQGVAQTNTLVNNVVPIVQSLAYRSEARYGSLPFFVGGDEDFPANVIAYRNGLLDVDAWLRGEVRLLAHTPNWMSTFCLPHEMDAKAGCPKWLDFLDEVFEGDKSRQALLQEYMGYCLTADTSKQKALVMTGKRRAGKGTTQAVLQHLVGPANWQAFSLDQLVTDFGMSALVNKTVAVVGEVELTGNKDRAKILERLKSVIGEDPVTINRKHDPVIRSLKLSVRFVIACNQLPVFFDPSQAISSRLLFLGYEKSFAGREDDYLRNKLLAEAPGINLWALEGLRRLKANGRFTESATHQKLLRDFALLGAPVARFVEECLWVHKRLDPGDLPEHCLTKEPHSTPRGLVYQAYQEWCGENEVEPREANYFGRDLRSVLPGLQSSTQRIQNGYPQHVYKGIGIRKKSAWQEAAADRNNPENYDARGKWVGDFMQAAQDEVNRLHNYRG
jgi:P4 family phage/plasmid primase-like protien